MPKDEGGSSSCADPSCAGCSAQFASTITRLPRDTLESLLHEVVMDPSRAAHLRPALERLGAALGTPAKDKQRWEELNPQELVAARALGFTKELFDTGGTPERVGLPWTELRAEEHAAAAVLGYTAELWNAENRELGWVDADNRPLSSPTPADGSETGPGGLDDAESDDETEVVVDTYYELATEVEIGQGTDDLAPAPAFPALPPLNAPKVAAEVAATAWVPPTVDGKDKEFWSDLTPDEKRAAENLGFDEELWEEGGVPPSCRLLWADLSDDLLAAAMTLGYDPVAWDYEVPPRAARRLDMAAAMDPPPDAPPAAAAAAAKASSSGGAASSSGASSTINAAAAAAAKLSDAASAAVTLSFAATAVSNLAALYSSYSSSAALAAAASREPLSVDELQKCFSALASEVRSAGKPFTELGASSGVSMDQIAKVVSALSAADASLDTAEAKVSATAALTKEEARRDEPTSRKELAQKPILTKEAIAELRKDYVAEMTKNGINAAGVEAAAVVFDETMAKLAFTAAFGGTAAEKLAAGHGAAATSDALRSAAAAGIEAGAEPAFMKELWGDLSEAEQKAAKDLGFDAEIWEEGGTPSRCWLPFSELKDFEQKAANLLGYASGRASDTGRLIHTRAHPHSSP